MYTLKDIISKFVEKNPEISKQYKINIYDLWKEAVGDIISEISYPHLLKEGKLEVLVKNSTWMNQLRLMKSDIINKFNDIFGSEILKDIEYKLDRRKKKQQSTDNYEIVKRPIDDSVLKRIEESLFEVKDNEIKKLLKDIFIKSYIHQ
ncbi:MAG: DUF721 domain-containing protein [Proteobacteria bacterium]|nr:DUF721 domain-containing protein [Pseudomonadota bacterium]